MSSSDLTIERVAWGDVDDSTRLELVELIGRSARPCPFFMPEFIDAYLAHNERFTPKSVRPFVLLVRQPDGELIGALPLKRVRNKQLGGYRQIEFIVATEVDLPCVIVAPEHEAEVAPVMAQALARMMRTHPAVDLVNQSPTSTFTRCIADNVPPYARVQIDPGMPISNIPMVDTSLADYFAALSKRMRSNLSRLGRRIAAIGELEVSCASAPREIADAFDVYLELEARSWKRSTEASLRRHPERVEMYRALHASAAHVTHHVDLLTLDGAPVAGLVSIELGPTLFLMETCYDERMSATSPSNLLILLSIDRAIRAGLNEVALHGHFETHKERWRAECTPTSEIRLVRRASVPDVRSTLGKLARRAGRSGPDGSVPIGNRENDVTLPDPLDATSMYTFRAHSNVDVMDIDELGERLPFELLAHSHV